jgi:hypothetical protein
MVLILIVVVIVIGIIFLSRHLRKQGAIEALGECFVIGISAVSAFTLMIIGIIGVGLGDAEYNLLETRDLIGVKQGEIYALLGDAHCYYVNGDKVSCVGDGQDGNYSCKVDVGDYDKCYVEKYKVDYKMNFWTFNLMNGVEYRFYIPENMEQE